MQHAFGQPRSPPLTHFLCIPLATVAGRPQLADSLAMFHADVAASTTSMTTGSTGGANSANDRNATTRRGALPASALRPVGTLHLTLGVLSLGEGDRLQRAVERLQTLRKAESPESAGSTGIKESALKDSETTRGKAADSRPPGAPISIALRGLHSMQPPARASVLYAAPIDRSTGELAAAGGPFLELCERVRATFSDLVVQDERPLLLHATMVNTVYVRENRGGKRGGRGGGGGGGGGGGRGRGRGKMTFDARDLIERYEDFVWMEQMPVQTVALCKMGAQTTAVDDDGNVVDAAYPVEAYVNI